MLWIKVKSLTFTTELLRNRALIFATEAACKTARSRVRKTGLLAPDFPLKNSVSSLTRQRKHCHLSQRQRMLVRAQWKNAYEHAFRVERHCGMCKASFWVGGRAKVDLFYYTVSLIVLFHGKNKQNLGNLEHSSISWTKVSFSTASAVVCFNYHM